MSSVPRIVAVSLVLLVAFADQLCGQGLAENQIAPMGAEQVRVAEVKVTGSPIPIPAMKYRLTFSETELEYGDAAPIYYRAFLLFSSVKGSRQLDRVKLDQWLSMPLNEMPIQEIEKHVEMYRSALQELSLATRYSTVRWGYENALRDADGVELYQILLPEVQEAAEASVILNLKIRIQLAKRDFDGALQTLREGFGFSKHLLEGKFIVSQLVALNVEKNLYQRLRDWQEIPGSPNLYWAIAQLTQPRYDLRRAIRFELDASRNSFGIVSDEALKPRSKEDWKKFYDNSSRQLRALVKATNNDLDGMQKNGIDPVAFIELVQAYSAAKQNLMTWGYSESEIEKMPVIQAVVLQTKLAHDYIFSEYEKITYLPYNRFEEELSNVTEKLNSEGYFQEESTREIFPIAQMVMPGLLQVFNNEIEAKTRLHEIQLIEGLRDHAARHKRFPASLEQVSNLPTGSIEESLVSVRFKADSESIEFEAGALEGYRKIKTIIRLVK